MCVVEGFTRSQFNLLFIWSVCQERILLHVFTQPYNYAHMYVRISNAVTACVYFNFRMMEMSILLVSQNCLMMMMIMR